MGMLYLGCQDMVHNASKLKLNEDKTQKLLCILGLLKIAEENRPIKLRFLA